MLEEFIPYMNKWTTKEEMILAFIGFIMLIILWILGEQYEKELENKNNKGE